MEVIQAVSEHHIPSRLHGQGSTAPLRLKPSKQELTDAAGLLVLRRAWDRLGFGRHLDEATADLPGRYRPSLLVEVWVATLLYGGGWPDDLRPVAGRRIRRLFGWEAVPDPTTFSPWLWRGGERLLPVLNGLIRRLVAIRWSWVGVPVAVTLVLDSTVLVRYGFKQAGAEVGHPVAAGLGVGGYGHHRVVPRTGGLATLGGRGGDHRPAGQGFFRQAERPGAPGP